MIQRLLNKVRFYCLLGGFGLGVYFGLSFFWSEPDGFKVLYLIAMNVVGAAVVLRNL